MKKHVALTLLLITTLGVLNAHVDLPEVDGRRFVAAQGRLHDPLGWLEDGWTSLTRLCGKVESRGDAEPDALAALAAIRSFSPPDSASARLLQVKTLDDWMLAEAVFDQLSPAVVALRRTPQGPWRVVDGAIWSGSTEPWRPAPLIRRHLEGRAPALPRPLLACFMPRGALFQPG